MTLQRQSRIDYRMARRATLRDVRSGLRSAQDVCDAHRELVRAGTHIGRDASEDCPICSDAGLRHVTYVFYGKGPRSQGGKAVRHEELRRQAQRYGALNVYVVEVCPECHWHHLVESYWLRRQQAAG